MSVEEDRPRRRFRAHTRNSIRVSRPSGSRYAGSATVSRYLRAARECCRGTPYRHWVQGHGQLLLARESLPRRLSSHPQGRSDGRPRSAKLSRPLHETGEIAFDLRTCGCHPREARKYSVEVKVVFPRCQPWWQRGWVADDLAT